MRLCFPAVCKRSRLASKTYRKSSLRNRRRSAWRALALTVKAKITSVDSGIETFEEAFLAQVVVRDAGKMRRFGEVAARAIAESYSGKNLPPLLGSGS